MLTTTSGAGSSDGVGGRTTSGSGIEIGSFAIALAPVSAHREECAAGGVVPQLRDGACHKRTEAEVAP